MTSYNGGLDRRQRGPKIDAMRERLEKQGDGGAAASASNQCVAVLQEEAVLQEVIHHGVRDQAWAFDHCQDAVELDGMIGPAKHRQRMDHVAAQGVARGSYPFDQRLDDLFLPCTHRRKNRCRDFRVIRLAGHEEHGGHLPRY